MTTLQEVIAYIIRRRPGITDRQLTEAIYGSDERHQQVNAECRACSEIERRQGQTHIENYIRESAQVPADAAGYFLGRPSTVRDRGMYPRSTAQPEKSSNSWHDA
jgi:hypothetical protein